MKLTVNSLAAVIFALVGLLAVAATPSPSPTSNLSPALDKIVAAPPTGYVAIPSTSPPKTGYLTAHEWAQQFDVRSAEAERLLNENGFVDGYNFEWALRSQIRVLNEFVIAFQGGRGANHWLGYFKDQLTSRPLYQRADTISGIPNYFGVHETQSTPYGQGYLDGFVFVKGNDLIGVASISLKDDNLNPATAQAQRQYAVAPSSTIPPSRWPENLNPSSVGAASGDSMNQLLRFGLIGAVAVLAVALAAGVFLMRVGRARRPLVEFVPSAPGTTAAAAAVPQQMSADGKSWYDGSRWIDASQQAPPFAQRSPDGAYWWDGSSWRPVPEVL